MELTEFRVQNYKKIKDTNWIKCGKLTAFIGKNESGKSALFRGLSKLNPSDGEKYDGQKEFPRRRYSKEFKLEDWPVASVKYNLSDKEKDELYNLCPLLNNINFVCCTRRYSGQLDVSYIPEPSFPDITNGKFLDISENVLIEVQELIAPEGKGDLIKPIKDALIKTLETNINLLQSQQQDQPVNQQTVNNLINAFSTSCNEQWQKDLLQNIIDKIRDFNLSIINTQKLNTANQWVSTHIPTFIYFDNYNVIDSAIYIPTFITNLNSNPNEKHIRVTKCLFDHVGLDIKEISSLDPSKPNLQIEAIKKMADERSILMSSASTAMTEMFSDWWEQRKHKFEYDVDGPFFRVWVSDDFDPSKIELDQRSMGLQYFFSFYVIFLVEASGAHKNAILLLDEPGLHMHGTAQGKLVKFFEKLAESNQTLYTTHSPFMIDGDHLETVRVVYEDYENKTTKVTEDIWPKDTDALFPLQAAFGYSIVQTLFYSEKQLIVEGITDYWIFKAINDILALKKMKHLRNDVIIIPAGGTKYLVPLASMLMGHDIKIAAILDGDNEGRNKGKQFQDKFFPGEDKKCLFVGDYSNNNEAEMEDLFPEEFYLKAVKEYYNTDVNFTNEEKKIKNITKRVNEAFIRLGKVEFEKAIVAKIILDWIGKDNNILHSETLEIFSNIFNDANLMFPPISSKEH